MRAIDEGLADLNNLLMSLLVDAHRYSYFVKQQGLQDDQCLALSHHKPVSAGYTETSPDSQLSCEPQNYITSLQILLMRTCYVCVCVLLGAAKLERRLL